VSARALGDILWFGGLVYLGRGQRERAEELGHQLEELGERTNDGSIRLRSIYNEASLAAVDGRLEEALAIGELLRTRGEHLGVPDFGRQFASFVTWKPLLCLGRAEEVLEALSQATQMAGGEQGMNILAMRALCLAHLGSHAEALAILR
jgi:hypothetical protein